MTSYSLAAYLAWVTYTQCRINVVAGVAYAMGPGF